MTERSIPSAGPAAATPFAAATRAAATPAAATPFAPSTAAPTAATAPTAAAAAAAARNNRLVRFWLHAEGAAALAAGTLLYFQAGGEAWLFLPLLLLPDVALLGYLRSTALGAFTYDLVHNWAIGLLLLGAGAALAAPSLWVGGAILVAHVGMDRAVGYGLKYPDGPKATHLQAV